MRWDKTVANDTPFTLDNIQLNVGFVTPIMEDTRPGMDDVDQGLLVSLRGRMREIKATMWIEKAWAPKLQRENDGAIMERFAGIRGDAPGELKKVNAVRLYLRVITIADLAHPLGGISQMAY